MILALDLSTKTGWVAGAPGTNPVFGLWELPSIADPGRQGAAYIDVLADAITLHDPSLVIMEVDVNLHKQNPGNTALQQLGMVYLTETICYRREVRLRQATAGEARGKVMGRSRWGAKGESKIAVEAWCRDQGLNLNDHNVRDAYVLWRFACLQLATQKRAA